MFETVENSVAQGRRNRGRRLVRFQRFCEHFDLTTAHGRKLVFRKVVPTYKVGRILLVDLDECERILLSNPTGGDNSTPGLQHGGKGELAEVPSREIRISIYFGLAVDAPTPRQPAIEAEFGAVAALWSVYGWIYGIGYLALHYVLSGIVPLLPFVGHYSALAISELDRNMYKIDGSSREYAALVLLAEGVRRVGH